MSNINSASAPDVSASYADYIVPMQGLNAASMSPEALLSFLKTQIGQIDDQVDQQMNVQEVSLKERGAAQGVQSTLQSFGTDGPQTYQDLTNCTDAFTHAIASLPPGDPLTSKLQDKLDQLKVLVSPAGSSPKPTDTLHTKMESSTWQQMTTDVGNTVDQLKSGAEVQMLTLQNLITSRQDAVEEATGMMTKFDQTLNDEAKAVGQ